MSTRRVIEVGVGTEGAREMEARNEAIEVSRSCCCHLRGRTLASSVFWAIGRGGRNALHDSEIVVTCAVQREESAAPPEPLQEQQNAPIAVGLTSKLFW